MFLIDDLLILLPAKGFMAIVKKIHEMAEAESTDESKVKLELLRLQTQYELDQISEEVFLRRETELVERLSAIRERKKQ